MAPATDLVHEALSYIADQNEIPSSPETSTETMGIEDQVINIHPMTTWKKAGIHKPNTRYALIASKFTTEEPKSIVAAMKHPGWNQAVLDKIGIIYMFHTWSLVPPI